MDVSQVLAGPDLGHLHALGRAVGPQVAMIVGMHTPIQVLSTLRREAGNPGWTVACKKI